MSAGQQYRALFDFVSNGQGVLTFKAGDRFTLVSKTDESWWLVRTVSGENGLAPISYLEACHVRNGGPVKSVAYTAIYDYAAQDSSQLSFSKGQTFFLVDKTDVSWWTVRTTNGQQGLVPVNYIDKLEVNEDDVHSIATSDSEISTPASSDSAPTSRNTSDEGFKQALASIDSSIGRIHEEAARQGGIYSSSQKNTLQQLVWHRQKFIDSYNFPQANHTHSSSAPTRSPPKSPVSPKKRSPLPKRHAPPPPNSMIRQRTSTGAMEKRANFSKSSRYSLQVDAVEMMSKEQFNMITNPQLVGDHSGHSKQGHHYSGRPDERQFYSLQRRHSRGSGHSSNRSSSPQHHHISPPILTEGRDVTRPQTHNSPAKSNRRGSSSHTQPLATGSPSLIGQSQQTDYLGSKSSLPTQTSPSITSITGSPSLTGQSKQTNYLKSKSSLPTQTSPSVTGITGPSKGVGNHPQHVAASPAAMPALPTTYFSSRDASDLMEQVRKQSGVSHRKAQIAASVVLQFLKERVPQCEGLVDGMFAALEQAQNTSGSVSPQHSDRERLKEIFFEITECKDDSQQRGWAIQDDEKAISDLLEELLQILCDANPEVSKMTIMENKYEHILTLIVYYQMEPRVLIRLLLLKVFGVLCGLDRTVIGILLTSVLPNELGRDIEQNMTELQKALYSSTVCTMIFSTAEAVPLSVYDQWNTNYILFLLETIENPPPEDSEEMLPDAFINMILAFNQHFPDPHTNLVMKALRQKHNLRIFSEKLMYLINRGEDPVAITEPCCPDSITKFLLDLFSSRDTSGLFYTTDMKVLIDIVTRQLTDLSPGMEARTHYLELLYRIVGSTDYSEHRHRQRDLMVCLNRIASEEDSEGQADRELTRKIWMTYPDVFEEITDL